MPFIDAWFEAVSGVTTTGLSTLPIEDKPVAFLFGRAWTQWIGGIGVAVFALALIVGSGSPLRSLGFSSSEVSDVVGGTRAHAKRVVIIYVCLTAAGITALLLSGASLIDAVAHCMAAVSTGGFANYGDSLGSVSALHLGIVNVLCIAGAISFHVYYFFAARGAPRQAAGQPALCAADRDRARHHTGLGDVGTDERGHRARRHLHADRLGADPQPGSRAPTSRPCPNGS